MTSALQWYAAEQRGSAATAPFTRERPMTAANDNEERQRAEGEGDEDQVATVSHPEQEVYNGQFGR